MTANKKFFVFKIYVPENPKRKGFVSWYDPKKGRQRKYGDINKQDTYEAKVAAAKRLKKKLEKGVVKNHIIRSMFKYCDKMKVIWKESTYKETTSKVRVFNAWLDGRNITKESIEQFIFHLLSIRSKTTAENYRKRLTSMMTQVGYGDLCDEIKKIKYSTTPAKVFQKHQLERFEKFLLEKDKDFWFAAQMLYYCFIRPGNEMHNLKVSDVDFDNWRICVRNTSAKNGTQEYVIIPIVFRETIYNELRYRSPKEYVFGSEKDMNKKRGKNYFSRKFRKYADELGFGLEHKFYSFKHTGALACALNGVSVKELQVQLRHKDLDTTDKYLKQLGVKDLQRLAEKFPPITTTSQ